MIPPAGSRQDLERHLTFASGHLPAVRRSFFERRFGNDFGDIRVHSGPHASEAAKSVRAQAFTVGRDIVFGQNQYSPESLNGQKLLAHELTHVRQQSGRQSIMEIQRRRRRNLGNFQPINFYAVTLDEDIVIDKSHRYRSLEAFQKALINTKNSGKWTLYFTMHGWDNITALCDHCIKNLNKVVSPVNCKEREIPCIDSAMFKAAFNNDSWKKWRDGGGGKPAYGPTNVILHMCHVNYTLEDVIQKALIRKSHRSNIKMMPQSSNCYPIVEQLTLRMNVKKIDNKGIIKWIPTEIKTRGQYGLLPDPDKKIFNSRLMELNKQYGYGPTSPAQIDSDEKRHQYYFDKSPLGYWFKHRIYIISLNREIAFWDAQGGPNRQFYQRNCSPMIRLSPRGIQ